MFRSLLILLSLSCPALANTYVTTTLASYHSDRTEQYNEKNYGLGVKHSQYIAGWYKNSHNRTSYYVGREFQYRVQHNVAFALQAGALTGYKDSELSTPKWGRVRLYALPSMIIGRDVQYKVGIVPVDNWTISFQIDWRL